MTNSTAHLYFVMFFVLVGIGIAMKLIRFAAKKFSHSVAGSMGSIAGGAKVAPVMKYPLGSLVEYKGHKGGPRWGCVVAARDQGLHGQARLHTGPGTYAWRSWSKLAAVK